MSVPNAGVAGALRFANLRLRGDIGAFERVRQQHGDIAYIPFPIRAYAVFSPDLIHEVLATKQAIFAKSADYKNMEPLMGRGLVTSEGEHWTAQRRAVGAAFRAPALAGYCERLEHVCSELPAAWHEASASSSIDVKADLNRLTAKMFNTVLFGSSRSRHAEQLHASIATALRATLLRSLSPIKTPRWLPSPLNMKEEQAIAQVDRALKHALAAFTTEPGVDSIVGTLLAATGTRADEATRTLRDELITLLVAGQDTVAAALGWFFHCVATHPDVMARVCAEVDALDNLDPSLPERIPYTHAAFQESLRLYPPIPIVARAPREDVALGPHQIRAGSIVVCAIASLHRHPVYWPEPTAFRPERFIDNTVQEHAFIPFASGPRRCIGERLSILMALSAIAHICRRFSFQSAPGFSPDPRASITLTSANGIRVRICKRTPRVSNHALRSTHKKSLQDFPSCPFASGTLSSGTQPSGIQSS